MVEERCVWCEEMLCMFVCQSIHWLYMLCTDFIFARMCYIYMQFPSLYTIWQPFHNFV